MTEVKKENRGYLYRNASKTKPTQPDFTGKGNRNGQEFRISAWENVTPEGNKYLSFVLSDPLENNTNSPNTKPPHVIAQQKVANNKAQSQSENLNRNDIDDLDDILKLTDDNPFE